MSGIETLREKLHLAIENGNIQQILIISQELDREILNFMKSKTNNQIASSTGKLSFKTSEEY